LKPWFTKSLSEFRGPGSFIIGIIVPFDSYDRKKIRAGSANAQPFASSRIVLYESD
jgi:hypothetical protein